MLSSFFIELINATIRSGCIDNAMNKGRRSKVPLDITVLPRDSKLRDIGDVDRRLVRVAAGVVCRAPILRLIRLDGEGSIRHAASGLADCLGGMYTWRSC